MNFSTRRKGEPIGISTRGFIKMGNAYKELEGTDYHWEGVQEGRLVIDDTTSFAGIARGAESIENSLQGNRIHVISRRTHNMQSFAPSGEI